MSEDKVDAIMGSNGVPSAVAMTAVAAESQTPMIALTPVPPLAPDRLKWTFVVPQTTELMMGAVADQLKANGVKTVGFIGFSDTWGDLVYKAITSFEKSHGFKIVTNERYARADTSVTGQVLKVLAAKPDAVVVGGSGSPAATPQIALRERGYKGPIYHNHGTVNQPFITTAQEGRRGCDRADRCADRGRGAARQLRRPRRSRSTSSSATRPCSAPAAQRLRRLQL